MPLAARYFKPLREATVSFKEFKDLMVILEEAGWRKQKPKKVISFTESSFKSF